MPAYVKMRSNPDVTRFLPGGVKAAREAEMRARRAVDQFERHWDEQGFGPWAIIEKSSGTFIGHGGILGLQGSNETELLYALDKPWWGKGFATELSIEALSFAFDDLGFERIVALAVPENEASKNVMRKCGLSFEKQAEFFGFTVDFLSIERSDWEKRHQE